MELATQNTNRISWIDIARGLGIISVIILHMDYGTINVWISSFDVPIFFFLSGYTFRTNLSFTDFLKRKIKTLIIPYFCTGLIIFIYLCIMDIYKGTFSGLSFSIEFYWSRMLVQKRFTTLWFLTSIFCLEFIYYFIIKYSKSDIISFIITIIMTSYGLHYCKYGGQDLPWNIDVCFPVSIIFFTGYITKKNRQYISNYLNSKSKIVILCLICLAINLISSIQNYRIFGTILSIFHRQYCVIPLTFVSIFSGCGFIVLLAHLINNSFVKYIGQYSLFYYAFHQLIAMDFIDLIFNHFGLYELRAGLLSNFLFGTAYFSLVILLLTVSCYVLNKTKFKFIIGK